MKNLFAAVVIVLTSFPAGAATVTVVMSGLDNPRGLALGKHGGLYVAEAGRGGSGPCAFVRGQNQCYGATGAITRLRNGVQERIVSGLPSYAPATGAGATGAHDVSLRGGKIYATIGLGGPLNPTTMRGFFGQDFGWLIRVDERSGTWTKFADIAAYEIAANPAGGPVDSNPYGLLQGAGGRVVVDAGGNSLLSVSGNATISTDAVFLPRGGIDAVPTSVDVGPDGAYYVGQLTGGPFIPGTARIFRVRPRQDPQTFLEGFNFIIDLTWGPDDNLYVLEHCNPFPAGPGSLIRVDRDGNRTTIATGLVNPTSVVVADNSDDEDEEEEDGDEDDQLTIYISNCGTCAGGGHVLGIQP
jgi:hypothetical protein